MINNILLNSLSTAWAKHYNGTVSGMTNLWWNKWQKSVDSNCLHYQTGTACICEAEGVLEWLWNRDRDQAEKIKG